MDYGKHTGIGESIPRTDRSLEVLPLNYSPSASSSVYFAVPVLPFGYIQRVLTLNTNAFSILTIITPAKNAIISWCHKF